MQTEHRLPLTTLYIYISIGPPKCLTQKCDQLAYSIALFIILREFLSIYILIFVQSIHSLLL